jgi:hypothetical protein
MSILALYVGLDSRRLDSGLCHERSGSRTGQSQCAQRCGDGGRVDLELWSAAERGDRGLLRRRGFHRRTRPCLPMGCPHGPPRLRQPPEAKPDKSDYNDAGLLADLLRVNYLPEVWLAPEETRQLRRLSRYRQGLAEDRKRVKLRIRALLREERLKHQGEGRPWSKPWMKWVREDAPLGAHARWVMNQHLLELEALEARIQAAEQRMEEATAEDPLMQALLKQAGIGLVTAFVLRAEIGSFHRFRSGKQLARFCSVTPLGVLPKS